VWTQPWQTTLLSLYKTVQLWVPLRQIMQLLDGNRTVEFCIAISGPTVWNSYSSSVVLDSSLAGFKCTLKMHLFSVHSWTAATIDWRCYKFIVIVTPDTIDFTYILTEGKRKHGGPHIVSPFCDTQPFVFSTVFPTLLYQLVLSCVFSHLFIMLWIAIQVSCILSFPVVEEILNWVDLWFSAVWYNIQ